jgi:hypothetical protein
MAYDPKKEYDYADVPELVGYLKRSAIDAYMMSENSGITSHCTIMDDRYVVSFPIPLVGSSDRDIARPGMDGQGGGETLDSGSGGSGADCTSEFDKIRWSIDKIVEPWKQLPDPKNVDNEIEKWITAVSPLAKDPQTVGNKSTGGGTIFTNLDQAGKALGNMSGEVIHKVETFVAKLASVTGGLHDKTMVLGGALNSEMKMFEETRASVVKALQQGIKVFDAVVLSEPEGFKMVLEIVSATIDAALIFTAPEVVIERKLLQTSSRALQTLKSSQDAMVDDEKVDSYDSAISQLESAFEAINKSVIKAEKGVESMLIGNLDSMSQSDHRKYYDVTMDPIDSSAIEPAPELNVDYGKAKGVCRKFGDVRTSVIEAKDSLPRVSMFTCLLRSGVIGIGSYGPAHAFSDLNVRIERLLKTSPTTLRTRRRISTWLSKQSSARTHRREADSRKPWITLKAIQVTLGRNRSLLRNE